MSSTGPAQRLQSCFPSCSPPALSSLRSNRVLPDPERRARISRAGKNPPARSCPQSPRSCRRTRWLVEDDRKTPRSRASGGAEGDDSIQWLTEPVRKFPDGSRFLIAQDEEMGVIVPGLLRPSPMTRSIEAKAGVFHGSIEPPRDFSPQARSAHGHSAHGD
jgi:hypothetical protein